MDIQGDSVTFSITDSQGFDLLYTIREKDTDKNFPQRVTDTSKMLSVEGYKPKVKPVYNKPPYVKKEKDYITDRVCPQDGGKLYKLLTKTGKTMIKCDNSKWDFTTKTASGCDFVEWPKEY